VFAHVRVPPKHQAHGKLSLVLSEIVIDDMQRTKATLMLRSSSDHKHRLTCIEFHMNMQVSRSAWSNSDAGIPLVFGDTTLQHHNLALSSKQYCDTW